MFLKTQTGRFSASVTLTAFSLANPLHYNGYVVRPGVCVLVCVLIRTMQALRHFAYSALWLACQSYRIVEINSYSCCCCEELFQSMGVRQADITEK